MQENNIKKMKIKMLVIGLLVILIFSAVSFGFFYMGMSQSGNSDISTLTCFDIDFQDSNSINLTNAISISDEMGLSTNPYHFELTNNCDTEVNYYVILNVKENSFTDDFISVSLNGKNPRVLGTRTENTKFDKPEGYSKSYIIDRGVLSKDEPISYDARIWVNADATYDVVKGKSWEGQIKVVSTVKELDDEILAQGIPNEMMARVDNDKFWQHASDIKTVTFENTLTPKENATYSHDVSELQDGSVMSYLIPKAEDSTKYDLYIQANGNVIANPDSSDLFADFENITRIEGLNKLDTNNIVNMSGMFNNCRSLTSLDLSNFDTSNVTDMTQSFVECSSLKSLDLSHFNTSNVTNMTSLFLNCSSLISIDVSSFDTSKVTNMTQMFTNCSGLTSLDVSNFDTSNVIDMYNIFGICSSLTSLDLSNFNTSKVINMASMFNSCSSLTTLDLRNFDTSRVTNMSYMFESCSSLTSLGVSNFDTSNVTNMYRMFSNCNSLVSLDVSKFNTSRTTIMAYMFYWCRNLTSIDVSNFDTSKVTDMSVMFSGCSNLTTLNVSNFDTSNVIDMYSMFNGCSSLTSLDVSSFNTSNVIDMSMMFMDCRNLTSLDVSNFDTSNVTNMNRMFFICSSLTSLDLSNFNTDNVTNMESMFGDCINLTTTITIRGTKCTSYSYMFDGAATNSEAQITVNYTEDASSLVDDMIATRSSSSNVVKNSTPEPKYSITLNSTSDISLSSTEAYKFTDITISTNKEGYAVSSFKLNGTLMNGNTFKMPSENVTISDVAIVEVTVVESEHNPYANNIDNREYLNKTWTGAKSLTVILEYQTQSNFRDWIYLYDKNNTAYGKYGGMIKKTETITIPGDTLRIVFRTDSSGNNYYGFKATVIPNYN